MFVFPLGLGEMQILSYVCIVHVAELTIKQSNNDKPWILHLVKIPGNQLNQLIFIYTRMLSTFF